MYFFGKCKITEFLAHKKLTLIILILLPRVQNAAEMRQKRYQGTREVEKNY